MSDQEFDSYLNDIEIEKGQLRVFPLGGLGEIGMNCMILETQKSMMLIDCGVMFSDLPHFGIEYVIPDFRYIIERADKLVGVFLTHGHEDHTGATPFLIKELKKANVHAPFFASPFTTRMMQEKLNEHGIDATVWVKTFEIGSKITVGDFTVSTASVNHSIIDASALLIDTPAGRVVHTGDFKIDKTPFLGSMMDPKIFQKAGDDGVLLLLSDSTNVEREEESDSERTVGNSLEKLFAAAEGLTVVALFSSNISRLASIVSLVRKQNKRLALCGRSMQTNMRLAVEHGVIERVDDVLINLEQLEQFQRNKVVVLTTGTQGEPRSALAKIASQSFGLLELEPRDRVIMSSRFIPGNEKPVSRMINALFKQGADVLYDSVHKIHVSGHATKPELKMMLEWTKPQYFIPVHGEYRHLVFHGRLARSLGMSEERVMVAQNGDVMHITPKHLERVYRLELEPRKWIDGVGGREVTKGTLKNRRKLAETGAVFALFTYEPEQEVILGGPEVILKGVVAEEDEAEWVGKLIRFVQDHLAKIKKENGHWPDQESLEEELRIALRGYFFKKLARKPVVVVVAQGVS